MVQHRERQDLPAPVVDPALLGGLEHSGLTVHRVRQHGTWVAGVGSGDADATLHARRRAAGFTSVVPDATEDSLRHLLARAGWWLAVSPEPPPRPGPVVHLYCPALRRVVRTRSATGPTGVAAATADAVAGCLEQWWETTG